MKKTKFLCLMISTVLVASAVFTGCASKTKPADSKQTTTNSKIDTSKEVKLTGYLLGSAPAGFNDVMAELNKKFKKDINATMEINYIGWGDMQSKYPLILASGENVDWIYTAGWAYYQQEAAKGAFREVTMEELQKYMPQHYAKLDKIAYKQAAFKGKNYMIPTSTPDKKVPVAVLRADLRKKYNIPEIKTFDQIEPYLAAIKQNEPNMIPLNLDSQYDLGQPFGALAKLWGLDQAMLAEGVYSGTFDTTNALYSTLGADGGAVYKKAAKTMKDWYDKGYVNKNPFSNKVRSKDSIVQGKSGVGFGNSVDVQSILTQAKANNMELDIIPMLSKDGLYAADNYLNNGVAVAGSSKNPERTLMALDLIMEQKDYVMLDYFGIEGKNYVMNPDGKLGLPAGVTAENNTYPPDAAGFWFANKDLFPDLAAWPDQYIALKKKLPTMLKQNTWGLFSFDPSNVKTEVANLTQVNSQYANPILVGAVKDVDESVNTLIEKQKAAGYQKVYDEVKKQVDAFLANNK